MRTPDLADAEFRGRCVRAAGDLILGRSVTPGDLADLLTLLRLGTDCTEEEVYKLADDLGKLRDVPPPAEVADFIAMASGLLSDRRRSMMPGPGRE